MNNDRLVQHGFTNIEVEKSKLLDIIKSNKDKHVSEFNKATIAYETAKLAYAQEFWAQFAENIVASKKILDEKLESVAAAVLMARETNQNTDGVIALNNINATVSYILQPKVKMSVVAPVSHERDYEVAIRGLQLSTAEFVYLDQSNFSKYVLDEWDWKQTFDLNSNAIISGSSMIGNTYFNNSSNGIYFSGLSTLSPMVISSGCSIPASCEQNMNDISFGRSISLGSTSSETSNLGANSLQLFNLIADSSQNGGN